MSDLPEPDARRWVKNAWSDRDTNLVRYQVAAQRTGLTIALVASLHKSGKVSGNLKKKLVSFSSLEAYLETRKQ